MEHEHQSCHDDMVFALYANLVMLCLACTMCVHVHGACALNKNGVSKYPSGLACTQANSNLAKITTSNFQVLNTQNANEKMPNMIFIAYLKDCNENLAWGKQEPLIHPYLFWYTTNSEKVVKTSFYIYFM